MQKGFVLGFFDGVIGADEAFAEQLLTASLLAFVLAGGGLLPGIAGRIGRVATIATTLVVLIAGVRTGHSGGDLVYRHGAANAYLDEGLHHGGLPPAERLHDDD